jgi:6-phosphogluconolactonase
MYRLAFIVVPLLAAAGQAADYLVFAGTYTKATGHSIYAFQFNPSKGKLSPLGVATEKLDTSFSLAEHPSHRFLYSAGLDGRAVSGFAIDRKIGKLDLLNQVSAGDGPCHLAVDATGHWLAVANYNDGTITLLPIHSDGTLGQPVAVERHQGSGPTRKRRQGPHAHAVLFAPDNHFLLAADLGLDKIFIYQFDAARGTVTPNNPSSASVSPGSGPRHLTFHPNGRVLYVINELANSITAFHYDAKNGSLDSFQNVPTLPEGFKGASYAAEIAVNRAGTCLYASNRGHDSIALFSIDGRNQMLTPMGHTAAQGKFPVHLALDPTEKYLLVSNQNSDNVIVFRVHVPNRLTPAGSSVNVPKPVCVLFVPPE